MEKKEKIAGKVATRQPADEREGQLTLRLYAKKGIYNKSITIPVSPELAERLLELMYLPDDAFTVEGYGKNSLKVGMELLSGKKNF